MSHPNEKISGKIREGASSPREGIILIAQAQAYIWQKLLEGERLLTYSEHHFCNWLGHTNARFGRLAGGRGGWTYRVLMSIAHHISHGATVATTSRKRGDSLHQQGVLLRAREMMLMVLREEGVDVQPAPAFPLCGEV